MNNVRKVMGEAKRPGEKAVPVFQSKVQKKNLTERSRASFRGACRGR